MAQQSRSCSGPGGKVAGPKATAPERYAYYPGTEEQPADEMRVTACGTGMPARHGQAATCWLVELGNGDKFLFDIGTGSMANTAACMIPCGLSVLTIRPQGIGAVCGVDQPD